MPTRFCLWGACVVPGRIGKALGRHLPRRAVQLEGSACVAWRSARLGETGGVRRRGAAPELLNVTRSYLSE